MVVKNITSGEDVFDYAISPQILPQIAIGVLVEVPFGNRKILGLVVDLKKSSSISKLKTIEKVISPIPSIDRKQLELAKWISSYYLTPLQKALFENVVQVAKRELKNSALEKNEPNKNNKKGREVLLIASFKKRMQYYKKAIQKVTASKRSVIIIIPDLELSTHFTQKTHDYIYLSAQMTRTTRYRNWLQIKNSPHCVVLGSLSALFAPVNNLGLIIVDQVENETYKNYRAPRFHTVKTAQQLAKISNANLLLGSATPPVELTHEFITCKKMIQTEKFLKKSITVIDLSANKKILGEALLHKISEYLLRKQKIVIVLNRRGQGSKFKCLDCGNTISCPSCQLPLTPQKEELYCARCEKKFPLITKCPCCNSINLKPIGLGVGKLQKFLKNEFPQCAISTFQSGDAKIENFDIAITTSVGHKINFGNVGLCVIADLEENLSLNDFRATEKAFSTYYKFLQIAEEGVIQSQIPQSYLLKSLANLSYNEFYQNELALREKFKLPPFTKQIKISHSNQDKPLAVNKLIDLKTTILGIANLEVKGPIESTPFSKNDKFTYELLIQFTDRPIELEKLLMQQKNIIIDVDPL